jgi:recombinational DNA repair protein RecT
MENQNQVAVYEPSKVRSEVIKQMESMSASKFVSLPETFKESVFFAMEKLSTMKDVDQVPSISVTKAFLKMFSNKLDFQKNHCYFFVQNDKESPTGKSLRFGWQYQGLIFTAKQMCEVKDVIPVLINSEDEFSMHFENGVLKIDKHVPTFRGDIVGGYCVVEFNNGDVRPKYYTKADLDQRRDKSMARAGNFWAWEREMYEKTLINASIKRIIETHTDTEKDDLYNEPDTIDVKHREVVDQVVLEQKEVVTLETEKVLL